MSLVRSTLVACAVAAVAALAAAAPARRTSTRPAARRRCSTTSRSRRSRTSSASTWAPAAPARPRGARPPNLRLLRRAGRRDRDQRPVKVIRKSFGTSVLGRDLRFYVVSTPDNIDNLDTGRADGPFWEGVKDGSVSEAAGLAAVKQRPAFGWVTATPHGGEAAAGEAISRDALRARGAHRLLQPAPAARHGSLPHAGPQPGRARRATRRRPHVGLGLRPQPRLRHPTRSRTARSCR